VHHPRACYLDGSRDWQEQDQQLVAVGPGNGRNSFLVARWRPPQVAECRVRRRCRGLYYGATAVLRRYRRAVAAAAAAAAAAAGAGAAV